MRKGLYVILAFFMTVTSSHYAYGQQEESALTLPVSYHIQSPYVVSAFPEVPLPLSVMKDTLGSPINILNVSYGERIIDITIDSSWKLISFTEYVDDEILRVPFTCSVDWYFNHMIQVNRVLNFVESFNKPNQGDQRYTERQGGRYLEMVGMDMGDFGRVSLRVNGNININGKLVQQDQELVRSSLRETQNTHLEFDQKQAVNIEGKIGDRITVKMDRDSERDFDWENNIRISYEGEEDDIVQKVEAGNISLSLPATQYVTFSGQNNGLFGLKAISKLGPVDITTIASIEKTKKEQQEYKGSNESAVVKIKDSDYIKNQYFFIHNWFRNGIDTTLSGTYINIPPFYPLYEGSHLVGNIIIRDFDLYKLESANDASTDPGIAYADLSNIDNSESQEGNFKRLEPGQDYSISNDLGFIRLRNRSSNEAFGCTFVLANRQTGDTLLTVGSGVNAADSTSSLILKMIKPISLTPSHSTWGLMFKNVYYMGASNINKEGFVVRIINQRQNPPSEYDLGGTPYITQFGLDSLNETGVRQSDELIDMENSSIINMGSGELMFPTYYPFAYDSLDGGNKNIELQSVLGEGKMYTTTTQTEINNDSRFEIQVEYTNQSSNINLGFMIVEGSEQVFVDGLELKRGVDYQIDYFSGTLIMNEELNPNAALKILFDKHEVVSFDKKTIFGTRAQMDFGERSFIGATALYFNQSVMNEKIEVGYEPTRNFIWGVNGRYDQPIEGLTRFLDKLPIINTEKTSSFSIEGEIAQVMPNPNSINNAETGDPSGVAYIDDFEGAKRTTSFPVQRRFWKTSSPPLLGSLNRTLSHRNRANMYWYNPYVQWRTKDIWPNQETSIRAQNETTDILVMNYKPFDHQSNLPQDSLWAGIITTLYSGDYDQTQTKFFEIWVRNKNDAKSKLSIDLGKISEDWNGDGSLNTEDIPVAGMIGDGLLDDSEDIGLDGCADEIEDGWGGCLEFGGTYNEYLSSGESELINTGSDIDPSDPNGDNWNYSEGSNDYKRINGTEGNALDAGRYPDTEDLDRTGFLDKTNDYFTKTFTLDDTAYFSGETVKNGQATGWKLFRIPLSHFEMADSTGNQEWNEIKFCRIRLSDTTQTWIQVAKIELVGNEWQELGIAADSSEVYSKVNSDSVFAISVINTEDNANYQPPKGVKGEYDRINEIRSKEQSLVLKFDNLAPKEKGAALKTLLNLSGDRAKSYLTYDKLKMYVYGNSPWIQDSETKVEFFMRFGLGEDYYELIQPVYQGWDESENRNTISLNLKWLTQLKIHDSTNVKKLNENDMITDSSGTKYYTFYDDEGVPTGKQIRIKGKPALSRIKFFMVGVKNISDEWINGEVWIDELRLSGVKKDRGVAMRLTSKLSVADIANTSITYSRKDADFHVLQQRLGTNQTGENFNLNTNFQLHKLLPKSWGISIPLNLSMTNSTNTPKYFPGSDILVNQGEAPDSILTKSTGLNFSTSLSKSSKSDNKIIQYTLDKIKPSFTASRSLSSNELNKEVLNEKYSGKVSYSLPFGRDNYISPFKWFKPIPLLGQKLSEIHFYYTPSNFNTSLNFSESLSQRIKRVGGKSPDTYNFGLNRNFSMDYMLTDGIKTKYTRAVKSDMQDYRGYAWLAIKDLDPGVVENISENLSTSFNPTIFSWFKPNMNYSSAYSWNQDRESTIGGANIGTQLRFSSSIALSLANMFEVIYKPPTKASTAPKGRSRRRRAKQEEETVEEKVQKDIPILTFAHGFLKKINPINFSYSENLTRTGRGVIGDVPLGYRFGWEPDHRLPHSEKIGSDIGAWDHKRDFSLRSGFNLTRSISTSFNYSQNVSTKRSGSGTEQRNMSRDYFAYGEKLENGLPLPGWSVRWSGLEKLPIIKKFLRSLSLEHGFSGKEVRAWQFENFAGPNMPLLDLETFISDFQEFERSSRVNTNFSPLIGLTASLQKGISMNFRHNLSKSLDRVPTGITVHRDKSYTSSANYSHRGGITIPLPFMEDYKIQNTVNFQFNFDMNESETLGSKNGGLEFGQTAFNSGWKAGIRITYTFSAKVSGSMIYGYHENESMTTGKKIDRDFGFDVNIAITG
ncbi:uncharacterized protein METZ01_LOCUS10720 [marine metagenome]|uniref:Gliding motility protein SprA N-terminal domain-containing protein n=1 Tax=marine metagenome TaxID=408172 RepID=A0A381NT98_9ZZZZ